MWVVVAALWAGPAKFLGRKELWGEQRLLSGAVSHPLLDTLQVEEAAALDTAPHLRVEEKGRWRGGEGEERGEVEGRWRGGEEEVEGRREGRWRGGERGKKRNKDRGCGRKGKDT